MLAPLPVAIVGAGHIHAASYLRSLLAHPHVRVAGVYDADPQVARALAEPAGVLAYADIHAALSAATGVVVASEPTRQAALVTAAAGAGKAVLCEKPLGVARAESADLLALADTVPLTVALPVRYHPAAVALRDAVQAGALGETAAVWATNRNSFPGGWFADPALAGGGCLLDHVVHVADLLRWVWGVEFDRVRAEAGSLHVPGLTVEDTAVALVECNDGMIVTIDPSMNRPGGMPGALDLVMKVWSERGVTDVDIFADCFHLVDRNGFTHRRGLDVDIDAALIDAWVDSVVDEGPVPVSAADAFAATALALAAREAATTQHTVPVAA
jgi:myo-inositol 2-dehydrogenase/D-chiro-inositol 1-dehydrogenase